MTPGRVGAVAWWAGPGIAAAVMATCAGLNFARGSWSAAAAWATAAVVMMIDRASTFWAYRGGYFRGYKHALDDAHSAYHEGSPAPFHRRRAKGLPRPWDESDDEGAHHHDHA